MIELRYLVVCEYARLHLARQPQKHGLYSEWKLYKGKLDF